jgi:hypothetical protein
MLDNIGDLDGRLHGAATSVSSFTPCRFSLCILWQESTIQDHPITRSKQGKKLA